MEQGEIDSAKTKTDLIKLIREVEVDDDENIRFYDPDADDEKE
jgi:hypothetical protein